MAKLVDAPHSKCGGFGRESSSLSLPILRKRNTHDDSATQELGVSPQTGKKFQGERGICPITATAQTAATITEEAPRSEFSTRKREDAKFSSSLFFGV